MFKRLIGASRLCAILSTTVLLGSCAELLISPDQCVGPAMEDLGYRDGVNGQAYRLDRLTALCANVGASADGARYRAGYEAGLDVFCTPARGYNEGLLERSYLGVCPPVLEPAFLAAYRRGLLDARRYWSEDDDDDDDYEPRRKRPRRGSGEPDEPREDPPDDDLPDRNGRDDRGDDDWDRDDGASKDERDDGPDERESDDYDSDSDRSDTDASDRDEPDTDTSDRDDDEPYEEDDADCLTPPCD